MKRFSNNSNIYNQHDIIKSTSELGVNLFRKYANSFLFKSLVNGKGINITGLCEVKISATLDPPERVIIRCAFLNFSKILTLVVKKE